MDSLPKLRWALLALQAAALPSVGCWYVCNESTDTGHTVLNRIEKDAEGRLFTTGYYAKTYSTCEDLCRDQPGLVELQRCSVREDSDDASVPPAGRSRVTVTCDGIWVRCSEVPSLGSGRAPESYVPLRSGERLAELAHMESAAAVAFRRLAEELRTFLAPSRLVDAAHRAAEDEVRHYALMKDAAARFGETAVAYEPEFLPSRSLLDVAIENAREGVVYETFGAVLNAYQADHAEDASVRTVFATIARDEVRHALLSIQVHEWFMTQLDGRSRARVERELRMAIANLSTGLPAPSARAKELGRPTVETERQLLNTLAKTVWNACAA